MSSSSVESSAFQNKDTMMVVYSKNGKDISSLSNLTSENEILFKPDSKFEVLDVYIDANTNERVILLDEIGENK